MKNIIIVIVLLIPLWTLSQNIDITPEQKQRIDEIMTPEKIIDISKCISNEKRLTKEVQDREAKIDSLIALIDFMEKDYRQTLEEIAKANNTAKDSSKDIDDITDDQIKRLKLKWTGFHFYGGFETTQFRFNDMSFNAELMYELPKLQIGLKGLTERIREPDNKNYIFTYGIKVRYKFF